MQYIDRTTYQYPLDRWNLMARNPEIGSKTNYTPADLEVLNVWEVQTRSSNLNPNYHQICEEKQPIQIDGIWYQDWVIREMSAEEYQTVETAQWAQVNQQLHTLTDREVRYLADGNVVLANVKIYDYTLPVGNNNVVIHQSKVTINGIQIDLIPEGGIYIDDVRIDLTHDEAIIADTISYAFTHDPQPPPASLPPVSNVFIANVTLVVDPYPSVIQEIPYHGPEVTQEQLHDYLAELIAISHQPNPFLIKWPPDPFQPPV